MNVYPMKANPMRKNNTMPLGLTRLVTAALAVLLSAPDAALAPPPDGEEKSGGLIGGLDPLGREHEKNAALLGSGLAGDVAGSSTGIADSFGESPNLDAEFFLDGSISVTERTRETRIDLAGSTMTLPDGTKRKYDKDGNVVREWREHPDDFEWIRNENGTSTETTYDEEGNLVSTVTRYEDGRLKYGERHSASGTETAKRNDDGSVTIERRNREKKLVTKRIVHPDGDGYSSIDHETGAKTEGRRERDEDGEVISVKSTTTNKDKSSVERSATKNRIETVEKDKDGNVTKRNINDNDKGVKSEIEYGKDGKKVRQTDTRKDGSSRERWKNKDGEIEGVIRDGKGRVKGTTLETTGGTKVKSKNTHWYDKHTIEYPDGSKKEILQNKFGTRDRIVIEKDKHGRITGHHRSKPFELEPGQDYYEKHGGRNWKDLKPDDKEKYVDEAAKGSGFPDGLLEGPKLSPYVERFKAENENDINTLANEGKKGAANSPNGKKADPVEVFPAPPVDGNPPAVEKKEDQAKRRAELEKRSAEHSTQAKELQKELDQALEDDDRAEIRKIEAAMDRHMEDSFDVTAELAEMDARKNDSKEAARHRISQAIRKDAIARAQRLNKLDAELEDHTQAVAAKLSWVSAGADITTKTTDEARSADARKNLGKANLEAIERLEEMPGLLEHRLGDLARDKEAVAAAKKYLADRKKFAQNQVEMGTSERKTISIIRAAGVTGDIDNILIGGTRARGGGKLVSRGLTMARGAKAPRVAPRLAQSGVVSQAGRSSSRAGSGVLPPSASRSADTVLDSAPLKAASETGETVIDFVRRQPNPLGKGGFHQVADAAGDMRRQLNLLVKDSTIIMRGLRPAGLTIGHASRNASPATIRRLWEKGRNLTREEILLKVDLILSGKVPATGPR